LNQERNERKEPDFSGNLITGVVLVGIFGLLIVCGGSIALKKGGEFNSDFIALFMVLSFAILGFIEIFLARQLSRVLGAGHKRKQLEESGQQLFQPAQMSVNDVRAQLRSASTPVPSVTENTTRTLENSRLQSLP